MYVADKNKNIILKQIQNKSIDNICTVMVVNMLKSAHTLGRRRSPL